MADTTGTVLISSLLSTSRFFLALGIGYIASTRPKGEPLVTREVCRNLSRLGMDLFLPCLMVSGIGGTLNPEAFQDYWHLVVASTLSIGLSNAMALAFGRLMLPRDARAIFRPVQMAIAFQNAMVVPLVLFSALCEQELINSDYDGDSQKCFAQATGMIFIFLGTWQIWFYAWGFYCLKDDNTLEISLVGLPPIVATGAVTRVSSSRVIQPDDLESPFIPTFSPIPSAATVAAGIKGGSSVRDIRFPERLGGDENGAEVGAGGAGATPGEIPPAGDETDVIKARAAGTEGESGCLPSSSLETRSEVPSRLDVHQPAAMITIEPLSSEDIEAESRVASMRQRKEAARSTVADSQAVAEGDAGSGGIADGASGDVCGDRGGGGKLSERVKQRTWAVIVSPVIVAVIAGIVIGLIAPLQEMLFHNPQAFLRPLGGAIQALGVPTVPVATLVLAGSLLAAPAASAPSLAGEGEGKMATWRRPRFVMGFLLVFLRLIIIPAAFFALFWLAKTRSSVMGQNRLMQLILLAEFAMPTSTIMISVLSQIRMPATAGFLSRLLVWQYAASSITVSFWTALAIKMLY